MADERKLTPRRAFGLLRSLDQVEDVIGKLPHPAKGAIYEVKHALAEHVIAALNPKRRRKASR